ncbi:MAG: hypothetical protein ACHQ52_04535 [Candidatus Eisenbacteria bacterium]
MKMLAILLVALAVMITAAAPSFATPAKGTWGVGYHGADFPLGARYWMSDKLALDMGLGFSSDPFNATGDNKTTWGFEVGVPIVLAGAGEETHFFLRPGIDYRSLPNPIVGGPNPDPNNRETVFGVSGQLGVEHWFGKRFSLQVAEGIAYYNEDPGVGDSNSVFQTQAFGISNIGFHYYFGGGK